MARRSKKERKKAKRRDKLRRREEAAYRREQRAEQGLLNPYSHEPDQKAKIEEDYAVMRAAWKQHFADNEAGTGDQHYAPLSVDDGSPHPWVFTYKRLMTEKYGSLSQAAPRVKFILNLLVNTPAYRDRYEAVDRMQEDLVEMHHAWLETYGETPDDFVPEFTVDGQPHPWIKVFERLMIEKYGPDEGPRWATFVVAFCRDQALEKRRHEAAE